MKNIKTNVAIVGYGNLGKAVEKCILSEPTLNLIGIFSRRKNLVSPFGTKVFDKNKLENFENKIDLLVLCTGSQTDMLVDAPMLAKKFDIINTFDTHKLIGKEMKKIDKITKTTKHFAVVACGWDPGLLSIMRAYFFATTSLMPTTQWGPGTSLGHSQAVRKIEHVKNAIALTIPNKQNKPSGDAKILHKRLVYVVCDKQYNSRIKDKIISIPNYFAGQNVRVKFVSHNKLEKLQTFKHAGRVVCGNNKTEFLEFCCKMQSNPMFTAKIVVAYAKRIKFLKQKYGYGAFCPLEFSPADLLNMTKYEIINKFC